MRYLGIILFILITLSVVFLVEFSKANEAKMKVVFCDVGQGDAILIRTETKADILVDGGPDDSVLRCLEENLPFWDREIEAIILTHPHADHLTGLIEVIERYKVNYFLSTGISADTEIYQRLMDVLAEESVSARKIEAGDRFSVGSTRFEVLWPTPSYLASWTASGDPNDTSLVVKASLGLFDTLLTGDAESHILQQTHQIDIEVLKVPHQGSEGALVASDLDLLKPEVGIIFVGENNYGHPSREILNLLEQSGVKYYRTDRDGDVKIESDGKSWDVKK